MRSPLVEPRSPGHGQPGSVPGRGCLRSARAAGSTTPACDRRQWFQRWPVESAPRVLSHMTDAQALPQEYGRKQRSW